MELPLKRAAIMSASMPSLVIALGLAPRLRRISILAASLAAIMSAVVPPGVAELGSILASSAGVPKRAVLTQASLESSKPGMGGGIAGFGTKGRASAKA